MVLGRIQIGLLADDLFHLSQYQAKGTPRHLPRQIEPVAPAALAADETPIVVLIVPPETILPAADRAGPVSAS
jgi:hypothetical protein